MYRFPSPYIALLIFSSVMQCYLSVAIHLNGLSCGKRDERRSEMKRLAQWPGITRLLKTPRLRRKRARNKTEKLGTA